jgi:CAAX protease family protein
VFVAILVWSEMTKSSLEGVSAPERALALIVGRTMELQEALVRAPAWERKLYELTMTEGASELRQAVEWYEELARYSLDPLVDVRLAILRGELGDAARLRATLDQWRARGQPFDTYVPLLAAAYLGAPLSADEQPRVEAERSMRPDWFRTRLAVRLARRVGDDAWLAQARREEARRVAPLLLRIRALAAIDLALLVAGVLGVWALLARRRHARERQTRAGDARLPPPWTARAGVVALIRGGAGTALMAAALLGVSRWAADSALLEALSIPLINLPVLVIARRRLFAPAATGFARGVGLRVRPGAFGTVVVVIALLAAAGVIVDLGVGLLGQGFGLSVHWTEWFDPDIAWGPRSMLVAGLLSAVVFAPLFEEIVFRGLLYGTLRSRFGWAVSAALSACVFALAHGYGAGGFLSVFLSGVLWAVAYEATGSLWPGIGAHAINNLSASLTVIWLLRG